MLIKFCEILFLNFLTLGIICSIVNIIYLSLNFVVTYLNQKFLDYFLIIFFDIFLLWQIYCLIDLIYLLSSNLLNEGFLLILFGAWFYIPGFLVILWEFQFSYFSLLMFFVVSFVALLVQFYSSDYLKSESLES